MPIKLEIPDNFFEHDQKSILENLFNTHSDKSFNVELNKIILSALDEYLDMFLGMGLPSRSNEIREYRLFYLIKRYFAPRIPDELEVSLMFQLPISRAKSLILYTITRFRYNLEDEIKYTLRDIVGSVEPIEHEGMIAEYRVFIGSENMVDELDRIITREGSIKFRRLAKIRGESNKYSIDPDSYGVLAKVLQAQDE